MKIETWRSRLIATLDEMERQPHIYGESDCMMRAAWAAAAQLTDPKRSEILALVEKYHGRYRSMRAAKALLKADGLTILGLVTHFFAEIEVVHARDGDIGALMQDGEDWGFGIFMRGHLHVGTETGTGILPRSAAEKAFRVD